MKVVSGSINLRVRGEVVEIPLTIPNEAVRLPAMIPAFQQMSNALVGQAIRQSEAEGDAVSCKAGCWACCRHLIPVTESEARYLAELVTAMPEPRQSELRQRFQDTIEILREKDLLDALRYPEQSGRSLHDLGMAFFDHEIHCPFLQDFRCSIHSQRPLVCREHLVTSAPENCDNPTADSVRKLPMPASVFGALIKVTKKPDQKTAPFVPLVLALEWAAENPDKTKARPGPDQLKQVVENL